MTTNKAIAETILQQLGGNKFVVMTGAKNFTCGADKEGNPYLLFKFAMFRKANFCRITLTPMDTYNMEFIKFQKHEAKTVIEVHNLYCDMLAGTFKDATGLDTFMGPVFRIIN